MIAVVTGASGFLGQSLVKKLIQNNIKVIVLVRKQTTIPLEWLKEDNIKIVKCSLEELCSIDARKISEKHIDIFYHFGWSGTSGSARSDYTLQCKNVQYTCDAVSLAVKLDCKKFIYAGSIMEYEIMQFMQQEKKKQNIGHTYSVAKLMANYMSSILASSFQLTYIHTIISNIYGAGEKSERFLNTTIRGLLQQKTILFTEATQLYDFIYITDAIEAFYLLGVGETNYKTYYIGNIEQRPLKQFILEMKEIVGSHSELEFGRIPFSGNGLTYREFPTNRLLLEFNFVPKVKFSEGVKKIVQWIEKK